MANPRNLANIAPYINATSSGDVGIGTSTFTSISGTVKTLSLGGTNTSISGGIAYQVNGTVKGYHYIEANNLTHQSASGGQLFLCANAEKMRLDVSGNLLVGTTTAPSGWSKRIVTSVISASSANPSIVIYTNSTGTSYHGIGTSNNQFDFVALGTNNAFVWYNGSDGTTPTERMRVSSTGNLSVGTGVGNVGLQVWKANASTGMTLSNPSGTMNLLDNTTPSAIGVGGRLVFGATYFTGGNTMGTGYIGTYKESAPSNGSDEYNHSLVFGVNGYPAGIREVARIDSSGRMGINTTAQTTNLARLQIDHDPSNDRYGIYVPGNSYVGSGPSGTQYGGYFRPHTSNAAAAVIGAAGIISNIGGAGAAYGVYGDGGSSPTPPNIGVYGTARQSDLNGPNMAIGVKGQANTSGSSSGGTGATCAVYAQAAGIYSNSYGVFATTVSTTGNAWGYYYEHNGGLQFRVKSNGGIDNYSGNNSNLSDRREKTDFAPAKSYLETICSIPVQTFKYINQEDDLPTLGVVAQDVQAVAPELVVESDWGTREEPKMRLSVYETDLVYALMKSIQELKAEFDAYKASHP